MMTFNLIGFKEWMLSRPYAKGHITYTYLDRQKFESLRKKKEEEHIRLKTAFEKLNDRLGDDYYRKIFVAQGFAMHAAALVFPPYSLVLPEDITEDWLSLVDFHKKHSRDHSMHQPFTAYIVSSLLGHGSAKDSMQVPLGSGNLLDFCVDAILQGEKTAYLRNYAYELGLPSSLLKPSSVSREFWRQLFYETSILSALYHDIGYPWQYIGRIGDALIPCASLLTPNIADAKSLFLTLSERMVLCPLRNYQHEIGPIPIGDEDRLIKIVLYGLEKTHGFPGAVSFLSLHDSVRQYPTPMGSERKMFSMEWASMGIMMHDMVKAHKTKFPEVSLSFTTDPLSSIVTLADYLEEFNRPWASFKPDKDFSQVKYGYDCSSVSVDVVSDSIEATFLYNSKGSFASSQGFKQEETEDYFNPGTGYLDISDLGFRQLVYKPRY